LHQLDAPVDVVSHPELVPDRRPGADQQRDSTRSRVGA
jgi:hypothetical protein